MKNFSVRLLSSISASTLLLGLLSGVALADSSSLPPPPPISGNGNPSLPPPPPVPVSHPAPPAVPLVSAGSGNCLPINQPIPFTITNGFYDGTNIVGGQLAMDKLNANDPITGKIIQAHINDLNAANIALNANEGTVFLQSSAASDGAVSFSRTPPSSSSMVSTITVQVDGAQGANTSATLHGSITISPSALGLLAYELAGRTIQKDPKTGIVLPQVSDFCVNSIGLVGKSTTDSYGNLQAGVILYMNKGNYEFEAENTSLQQKAHLNGGEDAGDVQMAERNTGAAAL